MQLLLTKMFAVGFAASMAFSGSASSQMPNANTSTATPYIGTNAGIAFYRQTPLDLWLEKLIVLESNGKENIKILDHNGVHSFGCLQFQKETFEEFGMKYQLVTVDDDTDELIYDCTLQKEIAKRMIEDNYNNWRHWYTSVMIKKLGLPPQTNFEEIEVAEAKSS